MATVEKAGFEDRQVLVRLLQGQFDEHGIVCDAGLLASAIQAMLDKEDLGLFLLAREDGQPVGIAVLSFAWVLEHGGKSAWLDELYVLPEQRGRGVGGLLLDHALEEARRQGCTAIDLEVEAEHRRAERLYLRKGFESLNRSRWVRQL